MIKKLSLLKEWWRIYSRKQNYCQHVQQYGSLSETKTWELASKDAIQKLHIRVAEIEQPRAAAELATWVAKIEAEFKAINCQQEKYEN